MRIGIDIRELSVNKKTGIGRFLLNFLDFISINDKQNQYVLFADQETRKLSFGANIKIKVIPGFIKAYWDQVVLAREARRENLDVFFSPSYTAPVFSKAKTLVTCHDIFFLELSSNPIANWLRRSYCRFVWQRVGLIIAVSQYTRQAVIKFLGCPEEMVRVVYDSVEERFSPRDKGEAFNNLKKKFTGLKKDFILYVGNLSQHKNLFGLLRAYSLLPEPLKERFQLVFAGGKDKNYPALLQAVILLGLERRVEFLGSVSEEDLLLLYNAASILTLVSFWEGFGLPALEAMACATPVVVSNAAALPEVVGDAGLFVNPNDIDDISAKLRILLSDEALRTALSKKGLEQSKKFKVEYSANKILEILKELCFK